MYLLKTHFTGSVESAISMDVDGVEEYYKWLHKQYERASFCDQEKEKLLSRVGNPRNYDYYSFDFARADILSACLINKTPDGYEFEIQFQTPSSQKAKDLKVPLYEERRKLGISESRAKELENKMVQLAEQVTEPKNISKIKSHWGEQIWE